MAQAANNQAPKSAINPTRAQDFPEWYQQVISAADLADSSDVRGCMVIKPWGYGIWERIQAELDRRIKATGHENAYFPLFIPLRYLEKEATHVEGFAKECAVVTHHRLELKNGKLVPSGELEEPLIVRPTSETIIGESFSRWIQSYRDLPLLINQWANVVRWEMRPRMFLRTAEFLWQEGHTAHATEAEAREETKLMLNVYHEVVRDVLALPVILGQKPAHERFPGAEDTYTLEGMMQDRKALQAGTSHYLGQNFAKASNIKFSAEDGSIQFAHTTSWGVSTRLIGGLIMTHGDDDGLRLPPSVAPKHVVVLPITPKPETQSQVFAAAEQIVSSLRPLQFGGRGVESFVDKRDKRGAEKNWEWVKKGIPLRIELGPRDIEKRSCVVYRRDMGPKDKTEVSWDNLPAFVAEALQGIQSNLYAEAERNRNQNTTTEIKSLADLKAFFTPQNKDKPEIHGGFVRAKWCEDAASVAVLDELKVTVRCLPLEQDASPGTCVLTGKPATREAIFAKSY